MGEANNEARDVFMAAAALERTAERSQYLDEVCRGKPDLRERVRILLRAHEQNDTFLEVASPDPDGVKEGPGTVISHYKLLEQIGEGGFGVVFMAEQREPIVRRVALKIVKAGMDTREVVARFETERQALALMDHPNIAKVFDAGTTGTGRPYFVMELVNGIPITEFCDRTGLSVPQRLRLLMQVCQATQHAHQKAVIHRDLKPANILVTEIDGKPVPKVIDFGIAKALGQQLTERTLFTAFQQIIGTPVYMSPEQTALSGTDVDTRSDIYSLGVLLYELLTGVTPIAADTLHKAGLDEVRRMIRETDPPKPSTRMQNLGDKLAEVAKRRHTEPSSLARLVHGDLDWIVMKAIEKDRARRYETSNALLEDLQRHLDHEPVLAGPPGAIYRLRKFIRRHRTGVALSSVTVAALLVGLSTAVVGFVQARQQRNRAIAAEQQALEQRDHAVTAEQRAEQERNHAEFLASRAALEKGQASLEAGDRRGLLDLVEAYGLAHHHPDFQTTIGRRWATWHSEWGQRTIAVRDYPGIFSPDYQQYMSRGPQRETFLYDAFTKALVAGPMKHAALSMARAFSPDGRMLGVVTRDGFIHVWNCRTGKPVCPPCDTGNGALSHLSFSACGRYLVALSGPSHEGPQSTSAVLLRLADPHATAHPLEHPYPLEHARFSSNGELLALLGAPELQLWRTADLQPVGSAIRIGFDRLLEFSPDGSLLALNSRAGIGLLDTSTMTMIRSFPGSGRATNGCFSHDGSLFASYHWGDYVALWRTASATGPFAVERISARLSGRLTFNPDDSLLAAGVSTGEIRVLHSKDGRIVHKLHTTPFPNPKFLPNGMLVASAHGRMYFWDLTASPLPTGDLPNDAMAHALEFDRSGEFLAVGGEHELRIWTMHPTPILKHVVPMPGRVLALAFSGEAGQFAVFSNDGSFTLVEPRSGQVVPGGNFGRGYNQTAFLSPDARHLCLFLPKLSSSLLLDTQTGRIQWLQRGGGSLSVAFRPDSRGMALGSAGWKLSFYDLAFENHAPIKRAVNYNGWVETVAYHPSGKLLALCVGGHLIHLYDSEDRRKVPETYETSLADIRLLRFSPDGSLLAAAGLGSDGGYGIELWHLDSTPGLHHASTTLPCEHAVWSVVFSPDNRMLVAGGLGSTRHWILPLKPNDLGEMQARTWKTLGYRKEQDGSLTHLDAPTSALEGIRTRLAQGSSAAFSPLDAALKLPPAEALDAVNRLAGEQPSAGIHEDLLADLHAELMVIKAKERMWVEARAHAEEAISRGCDDPSTQYWSALLSLQSGDVMGYRKTCRAMLEQIESSYDPEVVRVTAWAAALAPRALENYAGLLERLRVSALRVETARAADYRFYIGALLARSGRCAEAVIELEEVDRHLNTKGAYVSFSPIFCKFLLAICHAQLDQEIPAREWFDAADLDVKSLLMGGERSPESTGSFYWNRRLGTRLLEEEARLLQNEAHALLQADAPKRTISPRQRTIAALSGNQGTESDAPPRKNAVFISPEPARDPLARLTADLLAHGYFAEAEPLAREWLAVRKKLEELDKPIPNAWQTDDAWSLLGACLLGQEKYDAAEPLLLSAYSGMKERQNDMAEDDQDCIGDTLRHLVLLYENSEQPRQGADWIERLAEFEQANEARQKARIEAGEARPIIRRSLKRGNDAARNRRWKEAAEAFAHALRHPHFKWRESVAESAHRCLGLQMGMAFVRAGDRANHERICRLILTLQPDDPTVFEAERFAKLVFLDGRGLPEDLQERGLDLARFAVANRDISGIPGWTCQSAGIAEFYAGDAKRAEELLTKAEEEPAFGCRGGAMVYRAMALQKLNRDTDAAALLQQAETLLAEPLRSNPGEPWWDLELCRMALEEARAKIGAAPPP